MAGAFTALRARGGFVPSATSKSGGFSALSQARGGGFSSGIVAAQPGPPEAVTSQEEAFEHAPTVEAPVQASLPKVEPAIKADPVGDRIAELEAELIRRDQARQCEHQARVAEIESERAKMQAATARLGTLSGDLVRARAAMIEEFRSAAGELLVAGAKRMAGEAFSARPELLAARVAELSGMLGGGALRVRVNPADHAALSALLGADASVVSDGSVAAGCIVESAHGAVDASVSTASAALGTETEVWRRSA